MDEQDALQKEIRAIRKKLEAEKARHNDVLAAINRSKEEYDALQREIKSQTEKAETYKNAAEEYKKRAEEHSTALDEVHKEFVTAREQLETITTETKQKAQSFEKARELELNTLQEEKSTVLAEIRALRTKTSGVGDEYNRLVEENRVLEVRFDGVKKRYDDMVRSKEAITSEVGALTAELQDVRAQVAVAQKGISQARETYDIVKHDIDTLLAQKTELETHVGSLQNEIALLVKEQKETAAETERLQKEYEATAHLRVTLAEKEQELIQREEYIKEQYRKIGMTYE